MSEKIWEQSIPKKLETVEKQDVKAETIKELEKLKQELSWEITPEKLSKLLDDLPKKNQEYYILGLLSWLNESWIYISSIESNRVSLTWKNDENLSRFENILNDRFTNIKPYISKSIMYKSFFIDEYISDKWEKSPNYNVDELVVRLLKKHWRTSIHNLVKLSSEQDIANQLKWLKNVWEKDFQSFKRQMLVQITDINDREFISMYLDSIRWTIILWNDDIKKYKDNKSNLAKEFKKIESASMLNWTTLDWFEQKFTKNPIWALKEVALDSWWIQNAVVLWIIWGFIWMIFWKWRLWFWLWASLWFTWSVLWEEWLDKLIKLWIDKWNQVKDSFWGQNIDNNWNKSQIQQEKSNPQVVRENDKNNPVYIKYEWLFLWVDNKNQEKLKILLELSSNDNFLDASVGFLNIFFTENNKDKIKEKFKKYGIDLTDDNLEYYKDIFNSILEQRNSDGITFWDNPKEKVREFLERTSNIVPKIDWKENSQNSNSNVIQQNNSINENNQSIDIEERPEWMDDLTYLSRLLNMWYIVSDVKPPELNNWFWQKSIFWKTFYTINPFWLTSDIIKYISKWTFWAYTWWTIPLQNNVLELLWSWLDKWAWKFSTAMNSLIDLEWHKIKIDLQNQINKLNIEARNSWIYSGEIKAKVDILQEQIIKIDNFIKLSNNKWINRLIRLNIAKEKIEWNLEKLNNIQTQINQTEEKFKQDLKDFEKEVKSTKRSEIKKSEVEDRLDAKLRGLVEKYNTDITKLNTDYSLSLSSLTIEEQTKIVSTSNTAWSKLASLNWWVNNFLDKLNNSKITWSTKTAFITIWVASLIYNWSWWIKEMWEQGFSEENKNNAIDMGVSFIPIVWWVYDLWIAYNWVDLNWKTLSEQERIIRRAFWVVWLIPWVWFIVKWAWKASLWNIITKTWIVSWAALMSWVLGYSIYEAWKDIAINKI